MPLPDSIRSSSTTCCYVSGRNGSLIALDGATGKEIWIHEGLNGLPSRGINYWQSEDGKDRRLLFSINNFLQAIDARTGKSIPTFGIDGTVDLRAELLRGDKMGWNNNSPGKVWKNLLILGSTTGEAFISPPGDIRAYDVITGKRVWQFHTIPPPGEFGYDTWPKEAYKYVGGANNWGSMSVDDERGIVYVPTGSATYDFYGADRLGQNLFANCLIALDARTGKRHLAFPDGSSRSLGSRQRLRAAARDRAPQRPAHRCRRVRGQDRFHVRVQPRDRRAALANRGTAGAEERRARRAGVADAAVSDQAGAVRAPDVHRGRCQSVAGEAGTSTPAMKERVAKARNARPVHAAGV